MNARVALLAGLILGWGAAAGAAYEDRFAWVFGWRLRTDAEVGEVSRIIETAAKHGCNGVVMEAGLDTLCKKTPDDFRRLEAVLRVCESNRIEFIPAIFSVGYGGFALAHDRNLAEGLPVEDAVFLAKGDEARHVPDESVRPANGGFEEFRGDRFGGWKFHDQPGVVSFADTNVVHGGRASLRLENFTANSNGHGRVMQELRVPPRRCLRVTFFVRSEGLEPARAFRVMAMAGPRTLASRDLGAIGTSGWQKASILMNTPDDGRVKLYTGVWGGKAGRVWIDDCTVEEVGPLNVLHRPGTPVTVRNGDGSVTYAEGRDYAPLEDPAFNPGRADRPAPALRLLPGGAIADGARLRVSWYYTAPVQNGQVSVCLAEPALDAIFDHEAKLLAERVRPRKVLLAVDEIRMGGTCRTCAGRNMGEVLGGCITRQVEALRRHIPGVAVYAWSDMFDPEHNAHGDYYLVRGDFAGSWSHVPKDIVMAVWGGKPRPTSLRFFADQGFRTLAACYYDAKDLESVKGWIEAARGVPGVRGFMYTPWRKSYDLLPAFGDLLRDAGTR